MRVPTLQTEAGRSGQSMAILEWLEEVYPEPAILPADPWLRLKCRAFADVVACDIHPLNNLSVLGVLKSEFECRSGMRSRNGMLTGLFGGSRRLKASRLNCRIRLSFMAIRTEHG